MVQAPKVVLDASAVVAWARQEPGYEVVDRVLAHAVVPASALAESLYVLQELGHRLPIDQMRLALLDLGVRVEPLVDEDAVRAAELVAASRRTPGKDSLSLGDGLCIATAERLGLTVTGGDSFWETCDLKVAYLPFR